MPVDNTKELERSVRFLLDKMRYLLPLVEIQEFRIGSVFDTSTTGYTANGAFIFPFIVPATIRVRMVGTTVLAAAGTVSFSLGIYKAASTPFALDFVSGEPQATGQPLVPASTPYELLVKGPKQTIPAIQTQYTWALTPELVLRPTEVYGMAFISDSVGITVLGDPNSFLYDGGQFCGVQTSDDLPMSLTALRTGVAVYSPTFILRSMKAFRRKG